MKVHEDCQLQELTVTALSVTCKTGNLGDIFEFEYSFPGWYSGYPVQGYTA